MKSGSENFEPAPVVLASSSAIRAHLLVRAGVTFEIDTVPGAETAYKEMIRGQADQPDASSIAENLAEIKATAVSARHPGALVIGADQVLSLEGRVFHKPGTLHALRAQLLVLRGRTHTLETAVAIVRDGVRLWSHLERPRVTLRRFSDAFLDTYLTTSEASVVHCAGGYQIETNGIQLFERLEGDVFSVKGLPLLPLLDGLRKFGALQQ
ncbi:Maf-like protein [Phaeovibrio sulfidiphilus]|uniref:Nucleoside triphosphate pyrophosphatase n=1 Tax=Phaeovibrio sulfidiphilus TaxID=1220600 RepID=A0A8J6YL05_9PROT|nr:nucleoside triphosphate pyrophosphatase [Phaeovibrio sulfidiphilus]MBE1236595.1 Maf-like protein [Phaeovibrio sulfidiphilus]